MSTPLFEILQKRADAVQARIDAKAAKACDFCGEHKATTLIEGLGETVCFACYCDALGHGGCYDSTDDAMWAAVQGWRECAGRMPLASEYESGRNYASKYF